VDGAVPGAACWASASDTVSTVAGTVRANVANPKRERALRRGITSELSLLITKLLGLTGLTLRIRNEPRMNKQFIVRLIFDSFSDYRTRWAAGCSVPSTPTTANTINASTISTVVLRLRLPSVQPSAGAASFGVSQNRLTEAKMTMTAKMASFVIKTL